MSEAADTQAERGTKRDAQGQPVERVLQPRRIKALDISVVNKIAAGEIIVAPVHALKELLENSIDAGATSIEILVKEGGLKLLQITDNGHGIDREDLRVLCERFTTSKLQQFEDLQSIGTYGFRGEALASISHVAHLSVTTRTAASSCAWKAHYSEGKLAPPKPGQPHDPKAIAGKIGTQITVEDLFFNIPTRRRAFRSPSEEYAKIVDLVARYAVHRQAVSFFCRKHGDASAAISVAVTASPIDRIRQIHGSAAANELTPLTASDADYGYTLGGFTSTANYHAKRITFLLFINHRSVESTPIRKAVDQVYHHFLPKGQHPFVYIDLSIDPKRVDVNVHPTKREVRFLHEDEIIEQISDAIRAVLATDDSARTFMTQSLLRDAPSAGERGFVAASKIPIDDPLSTTSLRTPAKVYENNLVRTDPRSRKITSMLPQASRPSPTPNPNATGTTPNTSPWDPPPSVTSKMTYTHDPTRVATPCRLTSIRALRSEVRDAVHGELTQLFMAHTFVGVVCAARRLAAVQAGVKLYLVDYGLVAAGYFYQLGLTDFGNFGTIRFEPPLDLGELLRGAARHEGWLEAEARKQRLLAGGEEEEEEEEERGGGFDWDAAAEQVLARLVGRREMLAEYFNLQVSAEGELGAIPLLLRDYRPCLGKLPRFLLRLGPCVDWTAEKECFGSFLRELAAFYAPEALPVEGGGEGSREAEGEAEERLKARRAEVEHVVEHALFPAFKARLVATKAMVKAVVEVADLKGLYRVFERC